MPRKFLGYALVLAVLSALVLPSAFAGPAKAQLIRSKVASERIEGLKWENVPLDVVAKQQDGVYQLAAKVRGEFHEKAWTLISGNTEIPVQDGRFAWTVPLVGATTPLHLYAVSPFGEIRNEKATITFSSWTKFSAKLQKQVNSQTQVSSTNSVFIGAGVTSIRYEQTKTRGLSGTFLTIKASYQGTLKAPYLDYGFTGFVSGFPISKSRDDIIAKFIGINARVGYALGAIKEPWRLSILGGIYYTTMIAPFGYSHVGGPMLFPVLRRSLSNQDTISCYAKFSPITDGLQVLSLSNREVAVGASWTRRAPGSHPLGLSLDVADLAITSEAVQARSRSLSVGFSYGF